MTGARETDTISSGADATDALVADPYRAAAGELPWGQPLAAMQRLFAASGVHLHGVRRTDGSVAFSDEVGGFPADSVLACIREYHRIDPRVALVTRLGLGEWMNCHRHFDDAFVACDRFYRDFLIPYGGRNVAGARICEDAEIVAIIGIQRGRSMEPLTDEGLAPGECLGRHVTTAPGPWRRHGRLLQEHLLGTAVLEQLLHPVMLIDEQQRLQHGNVVAFGLLPASDHLRLRQGVERTALRSTMRRERARHGVDWRRHCRDASRARRQAGRDGGAAPIAPATPSAGPGGRGGGGGLRRP